MTLKSGIPGPKTGAMMGLKAMKKNDIFSKLLLKGGFEAVKNHLTP
jgi:hypothetical protein